MKNELQSAIELLRESYLALCELSEEEWVDALKDEIWEVIEPHCQAHGLLKSH